MDVGVHIRGVEDDGVDARGLLQNGQGSGQNHDPPVPPLQQRSPAALQPQLPLTIQAHP